MTWSLKQGHEPPDRPTGRSSAHPASEVRPPTTEIRFLAEDPDLMASPDELPGANLHAVLDFVHSGAGFQPAAVQGGLAPAGPPAHDAVPRVVHPGVGQVRCPLDVLLERVALLAGRGLQGFPVLVKIDVTGLWLRRNGARREAPAEAGVGISMDEIGRATSRRVEPYEQVTYPLLDLRMRRTDCLGLIADEGPGSAAQVGMLVLPAEDAGGLVGTGPGPARPVRPGVRPRGDTERAPRGARAGRGVPDAHRPPAGRCDRRGAGRAAVRSRMRLFTPAGDAKRGPAPVGASLRGTDSPARGGTVSRPPRQAPARRAGRPPRSRPCAAAGTSAGAGKHRGPQPDPRSPPPPSPGGPT